MESGIDLYEFTRLHMDLDAQDASLYSPLTLAYIGDAVYELVIRTKVVSESRSQVNKLHKRSSHFVKAGTQAKIINLLMDELSGDEINIYKRGRNAKSYTVAKNASMAEYRMATGFEALIGYLYLSGNSERMEELIKLGITKLDKEN